MRFQGLTRPASPLRAALAVVMAALVAVSALLLGTAPAAEARSRASPDTSCLKRSDYYRGQRGGGCRAAFGRSGVARELCEAQHKAVSACFSGLMRCLRNVGTIEGLFTSCEVCRVRYHGCISESRDAIRDDYFRRR
jgi:hypothetical protein